MAAAEVWLHKLQNYMSSNEVMTFMLCPWGPEVASETLSICPSNGHLNCHLPVIFDKQHKWLILHTSYFPLTWKSCMFWKSNCHLYVLFLTVNVRFFFKWICGIFGTKPIQLRAIKGAQLMWFPSKVLWFFIWEIQVAHREVKNI